MSINKKSGICLSSIVLLILCACSGQQQAINSRDVKFLSSLSGIVRAMTFNIRVATVLDGPNHWNSRKQLVIDTLADNAADIVGLQEGLNFQIEQIQKALPQYANYSAGRNDGKQRGESCAIFYRKDRFALIDSGTFWFSNKPSKPGSKGWGNLPPRICSWVYLIERGCLTGFYVYNLHLDNLSQKSRRKSVKLLAKQVGGRKTDDPFIVMGDFNMELDNPAMQYLQKPGSANPHPKMVDSWQSLHPGKRRGIGTRHGFRGGVSGPRIDHIPISESARALEVNIDRRRVNGRYPSDHFPVIAKIFLDSAS